MSYCARIRSGSPTISRFMLGALFLAVPSLVSALTISPGGVFQGDDSVFMIYTPGTQWSSGVTVELGEGLTTGSVLVLSPELLRVHADVAPSAPVGPRNVLVLQDGETVIGLLALQVLGPGAGLNVPGDGGAKDVNVVVNPGFETGDMTGWIPVTWSVSTTLPHTGIYDAYDPGGSGGGGQCLRQEFNPPIDSNTITAFDFWLRQPDDLGIAQVAVFYQGYPTQYGVAFTNDDDSWTYGSFTNLIVPDNLVTAIHVCGFGGGYPTPDDSWADDFSIIAEGGTPVRLVTWGKIKAIQH